MGTKPVGSWLRIGINPSLEGVVLARKKGIFIPLKDHNGLREQRKITTVYVNSSMQVTKRK